MSHRRSVGFPLNQANGRPASVTTTPPPLADRFRNSLRIGTRGSALAQKQTELAVARLRAAFPELPAPEVVEITTTGDTVVDRPLADIGGKGLFAKEIEVAVLAGEIDLAVHSLKDLETVLPAGLEIAALLAREDPRDALICAHAQRIEDLNHGAVVATSSVRRTAILKALRPDLQIVPIRGNINTRLAKLADGAADALVLAMAGLRRLGIDSPDISPIHVATMLPSACQGVIALQCRADDHELLGLLSEMNDPDTHVTSSAERALLAALDGSCRTPIGGLAQLDGDELWLRAEVAQLDGSEVFSAEARGGAADAAVLGAELGADLRARAPQSLFEDAA
jgi:hydroxymethylbilane synthase